MPRRRSLSAPPSRAAAGIKAASRVSGGAIAPALSPAAATRHHKIKGSGLTPNTVALPRRAQGCPGNFFILGCMSRSDAETSAILRLRDSEFGRDMRFQPSTFSQPLAPLDRRAVKAIEGRHRGDAYAKSFGSWGHLVVAIFAQLSGADSLRGLETEWNAHTQHHYHLGTGKLARSTLADASRRRPAALFAEVFAPGWRACSTARFGARARRWCGSSTRRPSRSASSATG